MNNFNVTIYEGECNCKVSKMIVGFTNAKEFAMTKLKNQTAYIFQYISDAYPNPWVMIANYKSEEA